MITRLTIRNFILVRELVLEFHTGLCVITGETGAGKSILVGALNLLLGNTLKKIQPFEETKPIYLEAVFGIDGKAEGLLQILEAYGMEEETEIILAREITESGKNNFYLNGRRIGISAAKDFRDELLDFHGQNEQQKLLLRPYQLQIIDDFGDLVPLRNDYQKQFEAVKQMIATREQLRQEEASTRDRMELYQYQCEEIQAFQIGEGEDEQLQRELNILSHADEIKQLAQESLHLIYDGDNALFDQLNHMTGRLGRFAEDQSLIGESVQQLKDGLASIEDAVHSIRHLSETVQVDQHRLEIVEARWNDLNKLKTKYRFQTSDEILEYYQRIHEQLSGFASNQQQIQALEEQITTGLKSLQQQADILTDARRRKADDFIHLVETNIAGLAIPEGRLEIQFDKKRDMDDKTLDVLSQYSETGQDTIDFYFSANKGTPLQVLKNAVSGGELSRLLLAVKKILSEKLEKRVVIFDEIDTGIGGKTAEYLADYIHDISRFHQVLCITHLPQIAVAGDHHYMITKSSDDAKTEMKVALLNHDQRILEIARMLSGNITETAVRHAEELLNKQ